MAAAPRLLRLPARLTLLLAAAAGGIWLATLDYGRKISTNVLDLIPAGEREPELHLLRSLASETQARSIWCALSASGENPPTEASVAAFAAALRSDPAIAEVGLLGESASRDALGRFLYDQRFAYLLPQYLERREEEFAAAGRPPAEWTGWLAERAAGELEAFLVRPESVAFEELIAADPLLLLATLGREAGLLTPAPGESGSHALVWARLAASPLEEAGQGPVFEALEAARQAGQRIDPELSLQWTGVNRFAAASKSRIRAELAWLNTLSLAGVLLVSALLLRRAWRILHLVPVVLLSLLGGWVAVTALFDRVHILVFVVGALLIGAAVDYGFHVYLHPGRFRGERHGTVLRRVLEPLLASCLTTVIGFSLLWFSDLPLLRHVGVFVSAGLLSALAAALLYFTQLKGRPPEPRFLRWNPVGGRGPAARRLILALAILVVAGGIWRIEWRDDIRELEVPAPELQDHDHAVRALFGETAGRSVYLAAGRDFTEARERLAALTEWHRRTFPSASLTGAGLMLPTRDAYDALPARLRRLRDFPSQLGDSLERHGFVAASFDPFLEAWPEQVSRSWPPYDALVRNLQDQLHGPMSSLLDETGGQAWLLGVSNHPPTQRPPPDIGVFEVNQLQSLNRLFERYRRNALRLSLAGIAVVGLSVIILYGFRRGLRIFLIPLGSCLVAFGVLGWIDQPLNLFHLLGAFLGVCLSHDYAIFSVHHREDPAPPPSIRLAALTTATSFGVLALSRIPVVSALGSTVALIVLVGLLAVELERAPARL